MNAITNSSITQLERYVFSSSTWLPRYISNPSYTYVVNHKQMKTVDSVLFIALNTEFKREMYTNRPLWQVASRNDDFDQLCALCYSNENHC